MSHLAPFLRKRDIGRKQPTLTHLPVFGAPGEIFGIRKLEYLGYFTMLFA